MPRARPPRALDLDLQAGQATLEYTGLVVLVAVLLAGIAVAVADLVRAPRAPIDPIGSVRAPLGEPGPSAGWAPAAGPAPAPPAPPGAGGGARSSGRDEGDGWGRIARGAGRAVRDGSGLVAAGARGFSAGVREGLRERAREIARDPGVLLPSPEPAPLDPRAAVGRALEGARRVRRYVGEIRRLTPRAAAGRLGQDGGRALVGTGEEVLVGRGRRLVGRALRRAARPRPRPPAGAERPSPGSPAGEAP